MPANAATLDIERGKLDTLRLLPWQTDTSISIHSWGYVEHDEYRSAKSLIHQLVDTVAKNGNLLLNVGPKSDGTIPEEARTVLLQMGAWLASTERPSMARGPSRSSAKVQPKHPGFHGKELRHPDLHSPGHSLHDFARSGSGCLYATALGWPASGSSRCHTLHSGKSVSSGPVCGVTRWARATASLLDQEADGLHLTLRLAAPPPQTSLYVPHPYTLPLFYFPAPLTERIPTRGTSPHVTAAYFSGTARISGKSLFLLFDIPFAPVG